MKKLDFEFFKKYRKAIAPVGFLMAGLLTAWVSSPTPQAVSPQQEAAPADLSTLIPKGYILVPIDLRNSDQLDGLLGSHGFVDLYATDGQGNHPRLVGRKMRLVRAPLNPKVFAVLVKEPEAERFLATRGVFTASLRSMDEAKHEIVSEPSAPKIEFQKENGK